nr:hypothetical protein [uncultured Rhodopila sp.]
MIPGLDDGPVLSKEAKLTRLRKELADAEDKGLKDIAAFLRDRIEKVEAQ